MTTRSSAPPGAPCWADLWTSDVDGSRSFYSHVFGWQALEPSPEFGGYWMFERAGAPVAGGMGPFADGTAGNMWRPYFRTDDIEGSLKRAEAAGATVGSPAMPVADLGVQAVLTDPTGAGFGLWQPGTFHGFSAFGEDGSPSWFELHTRDHPTAVAFYRDLLGLDVTPASDTDEFRYFTLRAAGTDEDEIGIMDSSAWLPEGGAHWAIYWHVDDTAAAVDRVKGAGGAVTQGPDDTPYGVLTAATDPAGAAFKIRSLR
jgi:predicted enzyme related to lactoylglutathione lyase